MDSWLNMLLCGLLLLASLQATNAFRLRRSKGNMNEMLKRNITHLIEHYKTSGPEWLGKSVFISYLDKTHSKASCKCQALLLEGMLSKYEEIFQDMMTKTEEKDVKTTLKHVKEEINKLRHQYSEEKEVWRDLQKIHAVKVKNEAIHGALNDFLNVYNEANMEKNP